MEFIKIYAITISAFIFCFALLQVFRHFTLWLWSSFVRLTRSYLQYPLLLSRRQGTTNFSRNDTLTLLVYLAFHIFSTAYKIHSLDQLNRRAVQLFTINFLPLCLGGRTNIFLDRCLRLEHKSYWTMHRWIGRLCAIYGLIHGVISLQRGKVIKMSIPLLAILAILNGLSLLSCRRVFYELFLKSHFALALAMLVLLWIHVGVGRGFASIMIIVASSLWLLEVLAYLILSVYRNRGLRGGRLKVYGDTLKLLEIQVERPWRSKPGQYIYLTSLEGTLQTAGVFQAHPLLIAWAEAGVTYQLMDTYNGFSRSIQPHGDLTYPVFIDGPYGGAHSFRSYDKALFLASGVGITAHLLQIKALLETYQKRKSRTRRIDLFWLVEKDGQEKVVEFVLEQLTHLDREGTALDKAAQDAPVPILNVMLFLPYSENREEEWMEMGPLWASARFGITFENLVKATYDDFDAGNMIISLCGHPRFEREARRGIAICARRRDIKLVGSSFQPDETPQSKSCWYRHEARGERKYTSSKTESPDVEGQPRGSIMLQDLRKRKRATIMGRSHPYTRLHDTE